MFASPRSPQPNATTSAEPRISRRNWYLLTNSVILCWISASIVGITLQGSPLVHSLASPLWLLVHLPLLGALTAAVLVWSQHFADTLLRRPSPWGRGGLAARLGLHTLGAILVMVGMQTGLTAFTASGIGAVTLAAALHGALLAQQRRGALVGRFAPLVRYYVVAAALFVLGIAAGGTLALGLAPELASRLLLAHVILNIFGWLSVTALGTLVLLWPTVLHAKIPDGAEQRAGQALWLVAAGIVLAAGAALAGLMPLISVGIALWVAGYAVVAWYGWREARAMPPGTFAAWSLAAAAGWLLLSAIAVGVVGLTSSDALAARSAILDLLPPIVLGFAGQLLIGALSYLLPVLIIGSPSGARTAAQTLDRGSAFRVTALNVALASYLGLGWFTGPAVLLARLALTVLVVAVLLGFVALVLLGAWHGRRARLTELTRNGMRAAPGAPIPLSLSRSQPAPPRSHRWAVVVGTAVPLGCVALGIAVSLA